MKSIRAAAVLFALPALGLLPAGTTQQQQQQGERQEGPLRTGEGALETGTGVDDSKERDGRRPGSRDRDRNPLDDPARETGVGNGDIEMDVFGRRTRRRANTLAERLLGGWRLVEMKLEGFVSTTRVAQGFLHIGPAFLSMEIHAGWDDNLPSTAVPAEDVHTAFTADYRVDPTGILECTTVIGSYVDDDTGELEWERPGYKRRYTLRERDGMLELLFGDGNLTNSLLFKPHLPSLKGQRDIFGRQMKDPLGIGSQDIFGRTRPDGGGEMDIFGRRRPAEEEGDGEETASDEGTAGDGRR